jgi:hypothetical protein
MRIINTVLPNWGVRLRKNCQAERFLRDQLKAIDRTLV